MTDSPDPRLQYLSDVSITADHAFIRLHGGNKGFWYNYLYSEEELKPWAAKIKQIRKDQEAKRLLVYFNNHYAGAAVENALEFKELLGETLTKEQQDAKGKVHQALQEIKNQRRLVDFN